VLDTFFTKFIENPKKCYIIKGKKVKSIKKQDKIFATYLGKNDILSDVAVNLIENPENKALNAVCEKIYTKIFSVDNNYKSILEILSDISDDEIKLLENENQTTYDDDVKAELKNSIINKMGYYYLGNENDGNYFDKLYTLNSFLDNKKQENYIWQNKKGSCEKCKELAKQIYIIDAIHRRPHPNCKCAVLSVSDMLLRKPDFIAILLENIGDYFVS
jgi:hypothetical protein